MAFPCTQIEWNGLRLSTVLGIVLVSSHRPTSIDHRLATKGRITQPFKVELLNMATFSYVVSPFFDLSVSSGGCGLRIARPSSFYQADEVFRMPSELGGQQGLVKGNQGTREEGDALNLSDDNNPTFLSSLSH